MRVKNWDYRELRERIFRWIDAADGSLNFYCDPVPKARCIQPAASIG